MKQLKKLSILLLVAMIMPLFVACGSGEDEYAIEDALQKEWDVSNAQSMVGAQECNVFSVKVDKVEGNMVYVSYSMKSKYSTGEPVFVKLKDAKLIKDDQGQYSVVDTGHNE